MYIFRISINEPFFLHLRPHRRHTRKFSKPLLPSLLNPLDSIKKIWYESLRILGGRKMSKIIHCHRFGSLDLLSCGLSHVWSRRPIKLASKEVNWTFGNIYLMYTITCIEATKVEVPVSKSAWSAARRRIWIFSRSSCTSLIRDDHILLSS